MSAIALTDRFAFDNYVERVLLPELSLAELKVLLNLKTRSFGWQHDRTRVTIDDLINGNGTTAGTGLSRPSVMSGIAGLIKRGLLEVLDATRDGRLFRICIESAREFFNSRGERMGVQLRQRKDRSKILTPTENMGKDFLPFDDLSHSKDESFYLLKEGEEVKEKVAAQGAESSNVPAIRKRKRPVNLKPVAQVQETPASPLLDPIGTITRKARAVTQRVENQNKEKQSAVLGRDLQGSWNQGLLRGVDGVRQFWTIRERAIAAKLLDSVRFSEYMNENTKQAHSFIEYCAANWYQIMRERFAWMKVVGTPNIGLVLKYKDQFMAAYLSANDTPMQAAKRAGGTSMNTVSERVQRQQTGGVRDLLNKLRGALANG